MLATNYAALAVYDTNHDGTLDTNEQAAVAEALANGTLQLPGPGRGPDGQSPPTPSAQAAKKIAKNLAALYAALAPYDTDKNGQLDSEEQAAVAAALANGTLKLPRPGGPPGGPPSDGGGPPPGDTNAPPQ
jgi:Ca2+-binding EF-hand superfamily protein